jgi:hypothetical protein
MFTARYALSPYSITDLTSLTNEATVSLSGRIVFCENILLKTGIILKGLQ